MSETVTQILTRLDSLSQQDRAELAYAFVCSLEPDDEPDEADQTTLRRAIWFSTTGRDLPAR